ncbi:MAG: 4Fe-4S dicluster domain-containing protein [Acidimicrobiia bacterium]
MTPARVVVRLVKVIDQSRCIGCHACTTACKSENEVPLSVSRTYVKSVDHGIFPTVTRSFQVTRCNQCDDAPCVPICPTSAMFRRRDGVVDFDKQACIGCKACMAACPYDAIFINPDDHSAEKCNFCAHRLDTGLEPACAVVCPVEAIIVGDLNDPRSKVAQMVAEGLDVRRPEKETRPKLFYAGASPSTLDPLAARRPTGGIFAWAQQPPEDSHHLNAGVTGDRAGSSQAAAILSYDVAHAIPWDWRVGLYTWTKSIAAGTYLVVAALVLTGLIESGDTLWRWVAPLVALAFLGATGAVLVWDLEHPARFFFVFTRPHWSSWLVRGAVAIMGFGAVLCLHLAASLVGASWASRALIVIGAPFACLTAMYTAFLFAQARARELWQSALLPPHLVVQSIVAGSAAVLLFQPLLDADETRSLHRALLVAIVVHVALTVSEVSRPHDSEHARLAVQHLVRGRRRRWFWAGLVLSVIGILAPIAPIAAAPVLVGLLVHGHAYVQAGQSVPLA